MRDSRRVRNATGTKQRHSSLPAFGRILREIEKHCGAFRPPDEKAGEGLPRIAGRLSVQ
jgi:hypothetical protein